MKNTYIIFLLIFSTSSFAQTYFPFPDSVAAWRMTDRHHDANGYSDAYYCLFMKGDTLINGVSYNKLYHTHTTYQIDTASSLYYGGLREFNKKIYFIPDSLFAYYYGNSLCFTPDYNTEFLLYDFNVNVGDTVFFPQTPNIDIIITSIDSILIDGNYRKRYNYEFTNYSLFCFGIASERSYVEGIGNISAGLLSQFIFYFENAEILKCFEDDEISYPSVNNCMTVGIDAITIKDSYQIYPNPASEVLFIEIDNPTINHIYILDITGKEIYTTKTRQRTTSIDVSSFKRGLYIAKIVFHQGSITSKLISIN